MPNENKAAPGTSADSAGDAAKDAAPELAAVQDETEPRELVEPAAQEQEGKSFVVGIGASAGGVEALGELVRFVPAEMAFIVVQHLAPDHESILTQLLARNSKLEVVTADDGMRLEPGRVYVMPPDRRLAVLRGAIRLLDAPPPRSGRHLPIDFLFRSLAEDVGPAAIGVVLSGTGTDGTLGLKAIKAAGGFAFVQDPSTAKYEGMPRSALQTGEADFCLSPKEIGEELARIVRQPRLRPTRPVPAAPTEARDDLSKLFVLIRAEFGNDLTNYKSSTIDRRIDRRMTLHRLTSLDDYVRFVQANRDELQALYKDLLITVTSFFRDPEAFEALKTNVFPKILKQKQSSQPIRVWVPACATGEEAYSIAMCLLEYCEDNVRDERIQVFGTDVDDASIQHARRGIYPANIAADVSPDRLSRFFVKQESEYQISRRIRDLLIFSKQNLLKDAPFSRMDLVSCRNLLIYLQPGAQRRVLRTLHYALNPSGHLLLGSSETVGDAPELFTAVDRKNKIYVKKQAALPALDTMGFGVPSEAEPPRPSPAARPTGLQALADRKVLELYGPPGVVVNEQFEVLQFRGRTGPYLDPAPGAATWNLLRVARIELHIELKRALERALAHLERVTSEVTFASEGRTSVVKLDVVPLVDPETKTRSLLVSFLQMPSPKELPVLGGDEEAAEAAGPLSRRIQELERELTVTKEYLQSTNEERESTLEELKSANEELQSSNEELQSTNEELETSKEELQSTNEELTTVNDELQNRMTELSQTNDDLHNVLAGVDNAVVIVGLDLKIRRYTGAAEKLFHLVPTDVGRSVGFLDPFLGPSVFEPKVSSVIQSLATIEEEVLASNHRWYSLKVSPYKTLDHSIRGALVTLIDVDVRKRAAEMTRDVGAYAARFLAPIGHPLLIVDNKLRIVWCNEAFLTMFQLSSAETVGTMLSSVAAGKLADPQLRTRLDEVFASHSILRDYRMRFRVPDLGERAATVGASLVPASPETPLALLSLEPFGQTLARGDP